MNTTFKIQENNMLFAKRTEAIDYGMNELKFSSFTVVSSRGTEWEIVVTEKHKYRMSSTGYNSNYYGNCEVCGKHASDVYSQTKEKKFIHIEGSLKEAGTIGYAHVSDTYGHKECLESLRK